jgi:hypothetical protein
MADEADIADRFQELSLAHSLATRANLPREVTPRGVCYNCEDDIAMEEVEAVVDGEPVLVEGKPVKTLKHVRPFCDAACRDDYNKRKKRT